MAKRKSLPLRTRSSIVTIHEYCDRAKYVTTDSILVKLHRKQQKRTKFRRIEQKETQAQIGLGLGESEVV